MSEVINILNSAGIKVMMITGDNQNTAYAVGKKINLVILVSLIRFMGSTILKKPNKK